MSPDKPPSGGALCEQPARGRRLVKPAASSLMPQQPLSLLGTWRHSGLPAGEFAPLVGVSKHTLYAWHRKFH